MKGKRWGGWGTGGEQTGVWGLGWGTGTGGEQTGGGVIEQSQTSGGEGIALTGGAAD